MIGRKVYRLLVMIDSQLVVVGQDIDYLRAQQWCAKKASRQIDMRILK
jgi:hypothetical protein